MFELDFWKDLGNIFDAVMNYQKKNVEFNDHFINPWIRLGNVFERQDQANDAIQAYKRAAEIDPNTIQNWVNLGDAQFKKGAFGEASEAYRKAVTLDPEAGWPLGNLALCLATQGNTEEAIPLYKKSINLLIEAKDKAICWNRLGNAYRKLNDYDNAFLSFQKADQLDGENTGFNDRLDETLPNIPVGAPEEILEQMIVGQTLEEDEAKSTTLEAVNESSNETTHSDVELAAMNLTQFEPANEPITPAPNLEMEVEESVIEEVSLPFIETGVEESTTETMAEKDLPLTLQEKNLEALQIVEDVIAKVELDYMAQENSDTKEISTEAELTAKSEGSALEVEPIAETNEDAALKVEAPVASEEAIQEVESVAETNQEVALEVEAPVASAEAIQEIEFVAETNQEVALEVEAPVASAEAIQETESVAETNQEVMLEVEAPVASAEAIQETESVAETNQEVALEVEAPTASAEAIQETEIQHEFAQVESVTTLSDISQRTVINELAYEEYLKDVVEPTNILMENVDEIQSETPITKVNQNGEVHIEMDTKNAHVWNELGNIYLNAGARDDAITAYSKAIELNRHFAWPYSNLALAYVQKGRFAEAILLYQRGIELFTSDKDKAITWNRLGNVYRRINDYGNAIASYQTADELDPENATLSLRSSFGLLGNMYSDSTPTYGA
jgi:tetratricopeptide (TPR) repeat protein